MISDRPRLGRFLYARFTPSVAYGASSLNEGAFIVPLTEEDVSEADRGSFAKFFMPCAPV